MNTKTILRWAKDEGKLKKGVNILSTIGEQPILSSSEKKR